MAFAVSQRHHCRHKKQQDSSAMERLRSLRSTTTQERYGMRKGMTPIIGILLLGAIILLLSKGGSMVPGSLILNQGAFGSATWMQDHFEVTVAEPTFTQTELWEVLGMKTITLKYAYISNSNAIDCSNYGGILNSNSICQISDFSKFEVRDLNIGIVNYLANYNPATTACGFYTGQPLYKASSPSVITGNSFTVQFDRLSTCSYGWDYERGVRASWAANPTFKLYPKTTHEIIQPPVVEPPQTQQPIVEPPKQNEGIFSKIIRWLLNWIGG